MLTTSNLYAEKVFSEQPVALWSLDEPVYYLSLITENLRDLQNWSVSNNSTISEYTAGDINPVFDGIKINSIIMNAGVDTQTFTTISFPQILNESSFDLSQETVSSSVYLYSPIQKTIDVEIGFEYIINGATHTRTSTYSFVATDKWTFISDSFDLPTSFTSIKPIVKVSTGDTNEYSFLLHGITFGQHSENFNVESLGSLSSPIPTTIYSTSTANVIPASAYGLQENAGYYVENDNTIYAKNTAMPLVYGSTSSTRLIPNPNGPSLMVPGFGFMNEDGQYKDITFEAWLRIKSQTKEPRRVIGPVATDDGLYVHDAFLTLKVDGKSGSYFVGEWDRPMLIAMTMSSSSASLIVNGEVVISLNLDSNSLVLSAKTINGKDANWIGFYGYADIPAIDVDCIGIYPYLVPEIVEKRRWVYGQAVGIPEALGSNDVGTTVIADYTVSNYGKNYLYPDMGSWNQGIVENLIIEGNRLSLPKYNLPEIVFKNKLVSDWYKDLAKTQQQAAEFLSLQPTDLWKDSRGYISFSNNSMLNDNARSFYMLVESDPNTLGDQILFMLRNDITGETLSAIINADTLVYRFESLNVSGDHVIEDVATIHGFTPGSAFGVGIDIPMFSKSFGAKVSAFLGNKSDLKLYVGGDPSEKLGITFSGYIYRVGFCTPRNFQKISDIFLDTGIIKLASAVEISGAYDGGAPDTITWDQTADGGVSLTNSSAIYGLEVDGGGIFPIIVQRLLDHVGSYNIVPKTFVGNFGLDIAVNGYWQDYVPLSHFTKTITGPDSKQIRSLDYIQFNIGYPPISKIVNNAHDTSGATVKTYVSFQYLKSSSTANPNYYLYTKPLAASNVVSPGDDWLNTKYEVVNDTVIYMPPNININSVAIVVHVEVLADGIVQTPVKLQTIQLSARSQNYFAPNSIGTKMGVDIYPYKRAGEYFDYKGKNPLSVYKGSTPHLYMTSTSGFRLRGINEDGIQHGISIPVNTNKSAYYSVSAWQLMMRYDEELFPELPVEIMEIESADRYIKFYLKSDTVSRQRGMIFAIDAETGHVQDVSFYVNGILVKNPYIDLHSWTTIGIVFNFAIDFSYYPGSFSITGPILFNNVSHYQSSRRDSIQGIGYRRWSSVLGDNLKWEYWLGTAPYKKWKDVLFTRTSDFVEVDGTQIYRKLTGSDRLIVDSESTFTINSYKYSVYSSVGWQSSVVTSA